MSDNSSDKYESASNHSYNSYSSQEEVIKKQKKTKESKESKETKESKESKETKETKETDILKKYLDDEQFKKEKYLSNYIKLINFFEKKVHPLFCKQFVNFSNGKFQKDKTSQSFDLTMLSFNHLPAKIIMTDFFRTSVKPTLNREKSLEHIDNLLELKYHESIFETSPLIFTIMTKNLKIELSKLCQESNCNCLFHQMEEETEINISKNKYFIYTLDGQHRLSTIYKYLQPLSDFSILDNKYMDFKFIIVNTVEEYKTIYYAINNSLPQKIEEPQEKEEDKDYISIEEKILTLAQTINSYFTQYYININNKKPQYKIIREDENISSPQPPCIHINEFKKSIKLKELLEKNEVETVFKKMIELNEIYSTKDYLFFGFKKTNVPNYLDKGKRFGFYLAFHKNNSMKFVDDMLF